MARILWILPFHLGSRVAAAPIAIELQHRGHDVVAMSMAQAESWFHDIGFNFRPHRRLTNYDWSRPEQSPWRVDQYQAWFLDSIPDQMDDILELLSEERYDLILADSMITGAGFAAERAHVPWASYVTFLLDEDRHPEEGFRAWWNGIRVASRLEPDPRPVSEDQWVGLSSRLTLLLGLPELNYRQATLPCYVHRVGPIIWDQPRVSASVGNPWLESLGRTRPAVLVSTSSAWLDDVDLVARLATGLAKEPVDVVATVPTDHDLPALPSNVHLTSYSPHGELLPKVSAVVCSGGFGLVTRAVCSGVPSVVVPRGGEAERIGLAVAKAGVGVVLDRRRFSSEGLRAAILHLLTDPAVAEALSRLKTSAALYDAPRRSADLLEGLLANDRHVINS